MTLTLGILDAGTGGAHSLGVRRPKPGGNNIACSEPGPASQDVAATRRPRFLGLHAEKAGTYSLRRSGDRRGASDRSAPNGDGQPRGRHRELDASPTPSAPARSPAAPRPSSRRARSARGLATGSAPGRDPAGDLLIASPGISATRFRAFARRFWPAPVSASIRLRIPGTDQSSRDMRASASSRPWSASLPAPIAFGSRPRASVSSVSKRACSVGGGGGRSGFPCGCGG